MKKYGEKIHLAIRVALTAVLLYYVYGETGWATTAAFALVFWAFELNSHVLKSITKILGDVVDRVVVSK